MKKFTLLILALTILISSNLWSQGVAINNTGTDPDNSAILDVSSDTAGILIPRMTKAFRDAISTPATGLMIYQTDNTHGFYYYNGASWVPVNAADSDWTINGNDMYSTVSGNVGIGTSTPIANLDVRGAGTDTGTIFNLGNSDNSHRLLFFPGRENDPNPFIQWKEGDPLRFSTDEGGWSEKMRIASDGNVGIGTNSPHASAKLEVESTNKGLLPPRMTTNQMLAISNPQEGLMVYNFDLKTICWFNGTRWAWDSEDNSCGFLEYEGQIYSTVTIGTQCWIQENLATTKYNDGTDIPLVTNGGVWSLLTSAGYCWYNNDSATYGGTYGALYNWYAVNTGNLCPSGWHVPTDNEWKTLEMYLGMTQAQADDMDWRGTDEGGKLKETGTTHWTSPNTGATNASGFTALPGGLRIEDGGFYHLNNLGCWWSATEYLSIAAWRRYLANSNDKIDRNPTLKGFGYSVRCLRD